MHGHRKITDLHGGMNVSKQERGNSHTAALWGHGQGLHTLLARRCQRLTSGSVHGWVLCENLRVAAGATIVRGESAASNSNLHPVYDNTNQSPTGTDTAAAATMCSLQCTEKVQEGKG